MHAIALDSCEIEQCCFVVVAMQFSFPSDGFRDGGGNHFRTARPALQANRRRMNRQRYPNGPDHSVRFLSNDQSDLAPWMRIRRLSARYPAEYRGVFDAGI